MTTLRLQALVAVGSPVVRRRLAAPPLPREHGTWAWLLLPLVAGAAAAGSVNAPLLLLAAASLAVFVARAPFELAQRRPVHRRAYLAWTGLCVAVALSALVPLLAHYQRWALLPLGALGAAIVVPALVSRELRHRWRAGGELLVVAGLSLLAPAAYHAVTGDFDRRAAAAWLPPALYGAGTVFYVRMLLVHRRSATSTRPVAAGWGVAAYVAVLWAVIGAAAFFEVLPALVLVALLPLTLKMILAPVPRTGARDLRRTGLVEVLHVTLFALFLATAYAVG